MAHPVPYMGSKLGYLLQTQAGSCLFSATNKLTRKSVAWKINDYQLGFTFSHLFGEITMFSKTSSLLLIGIFIQNVHYNTCFTSHETH